MATTFWLSSLKKISSLWPSFSLGSAAVPHGLVKHKKGAWTFIPLYELDGEGPQHWLEGQGQTFRGSEKFHGPLLRNVTWSLDFLILTY